MLSFVNDYSEGAHEQILNKLMEINLQKQPGYGTDAFCEAAKEKIRRACACPDAEIAFLVGGTQTNSVVIAAMLSQYEGVIAAETGHVSCHEAGAIEYTGHKVLCIPQHAGKMDANELAGYLKRFYDDGNQEHMVYPGMVYLSQPTEYGTLYTKQELTAIAAICRKHNLLLYVDGARLGYALACEENDVSLADLASLCDAFYIGGTKVGALFGEAVVFNKKHAPKHFTTIVKQHGALLAKGWLLGVQFDTLFTDELYLSISKRAIQTANAIKQVLADKGYQLLLPTPTNQIFVVLENEKLTKLKEQAAFGFWEKADDAHTVVRIATSWATTEEDVQKLAEIL